MPSRTADDIRSVGALFLLSNLKSGGKECRFEKRAENFGPFPEKPVPGSSDRVVAIKEYNFAGVIAETLQNAFGGSGMAIKTVMAYTGAGERTVKNWFEAKNGPNGENLIELVRHSDEILEAFLLMAGRKEILTAKTLVDARSTLVEMLKTIDRLQVNDSSDETSSD